MSIKRDRKHKPNKQLNTHKKTQIAQNTKQDRLQNWTKPQAKTNAKHKSKSLASVGKTIESRLHSSLSLSEGRHQVHCIIFLSKTHTAINCFWFIPINNTDTDLAASYSSLIFILIDESP